MNGNKGRPYMSIGEVLAALQAEFDDITVSKIRFLESEGLIEPERTASGYRKFYAKDLERLRLILRLQRDSFLPLKVIRERLENGQAPEAPSVPSPEQAPAQGSSANPSPSPLPAPPEPAELDEDVPEVQLTERDLADAANLDASQIQALANFGVICSHGENGSTYYDHHDLLVGKIARDLMKLGIEPRHMKTLRRFAEQEADMFGQLVSPAMRNRRPEARAQAVETLSELARLSRELRRAYVRQNLRGLLGDR
jgi:DNA-binding transcriptional MerR regulator